MRFLNKIVFINSASVKYTEINLDGNVHFIGTQGVGKSTLLRAILFFYNADKTKLGISREKDNFDKYYFPFQNSYIIFEVMKNDIPFSVLAFKSQGRVAFRFIDAAYNKQHFIDNENRAFENWQKTREAFAAKIYHTRIINNYEEYRNILYGNNKGLDSEFRKYALLESKQYQNIPRTIQNVFLNSKLDAEFIKETIIKSLNEEEIKIDLATYSHNHLRDFETELNDIKIWTNKNRKGEVPVLKQANAVSENYRSLRYLENEKVELAKQLGWAVNFADEQIPIIAESLDKEQQKKQIFQTKIDKTDKLFDAKKQRLQTQIAVLKKDIEKAKSKKEEYSKLDIQSIISRVSKKESIEKEKQNLTNEKSLLTTQYAEIEQKFENLISHLDNQLSSFKNEQSGLKHKLREQFGLFKDELNSKFQLIVDGIRKQHKQEVDTASNLVEEKKTNITNLEKKKIEAKYKIYFEAEIKQCESEKTKLLEIKRTSENEIVQSNKEVRNIRKEWELEESKVTSENEREIASLNTKQTDLEDSQASINNKIEHSKDSLYGWLNSNVPNWNTSIGKVIDEENILFKNGLTPTLSKNKDFSFYGINLNLNEINKTVKTVADYEEELVSLKEEIKIVIKKTTKLQSKKEEELKKLKRKYKTQINILKEGVSSNEYTLSQNKTKTDANQVKLNEFIKKANSEKESTLRNIEREISKLITEKIKAIENKERISNTISRQINTKNNEKEKFIKAEKEILDKKIANLDIEISQKEKETSERKVELKNQQKSELNDKGANTKRISELDIKISHLESELNFIENNRDKVVEYNKDKRELFDNVIEYTSEKKHLGEQLENEITNHDIQKNKLLINFNTQKHLVDRIEVNLENFKTSIKQFDEFKIAEVYPSIQEYINEYNSENRTDEKVENLIKSTTEKHYLAIKRQNELQSAVSKFTGNFQEHNVFSFKTKFIEIRDYLEFAENLKEFIEEDKISEYEKRVNERFANIIRLIGKQTGDLISKEGEIQGVINKINKDFVSKNFVTAINSIEMRTVDSSNKIMSLLIEIKKYNDEHSYDLGNANLFSSDNLETKNEKAIKLLKQLVKEINSHKANIISLSDSFGLEFKISENNNDTGWVEKLSNVGSEGTDVLVKAMINIMLLNVFKDSASKKFNDFKLHCMMDEIGKLHPNNVKGILKFANERNILLINGSPTSYNATDYKYTYILSKDKENVTRAKRLVKKTPNLIN